MSLPNYRHFIPATFKVLSTQSEPLHRRQIMELAAKEYGITPQQRREVLPSGRQLTYENRIGFALNALKLAGAVESASWGKWQLTDTGRKLAAKNPSGLSDAFGKMIDADARQALSDRRNQQTPEQIEDSEPLTPYEAAQRAVATNNSEVATALLRRLQELQPERFELLALQVLQSAGYGSPSVEPVHTGRSGDGGIDGWLPLDRLGLQKVFVQAKRYRDDNAVGAPAVRDFAGAMLKKGATMGVFVTLSRFTPEAVEAAEIPHARMVLMNGAKFAELMVDRGLGVAPEVLKLAKLDMDFFENL